MKDLGGYGIGLLAEAAVVVAANLGGTANDAVVPFQNVTIAEQFGFNDGSDADGTELRLAVRGSYVATFHSAFISHGDTLEVILGITKNTDAAGLISTFALGTTGRLYIGGPLTLPAAAAVDIPVVIGGGFVVEDSEAAATALGGAGAGAIIRAHATIAGDTHPSANTVNAAAIANWILRIERMGDLQGIARP